MYQIQYEGMIIQTTLDESQFKAKITEHLRHLTGDKSLTLRFQALSQDWIGSEDEGDYDESLGEEPTD